METNESYKLIGLKADGLKKLKAIEMEFSDRGITRIVGQNRQGKTSILDSIAILIGGKRYLQDDAIQHGKETMILSGQIGEYEIYREYTADGKAPKLKVTGKDGNILTGEVQNFLSTFINELTLSPFPFINRTPAEKLDFLMKLYKIDFSKQDAELRTLEEERMLVGREVKRFGDIEPVEEVAEVNLDDLDKRRKEITDRNDEKRAAYMKQKADKQAEISVFNEVQRMRSHLIARLKATIENMDERIAITKHGEAINSDHAADQKLQVEILTEIADFMRKKVDLLPKPEPERVAELFSVSEPVFESTDRIDEMIRQAYAINQKARLYNEYKAKVIEKAALVKTYDDLTVSIEDLREEKRRILRETDTRVEGLEIREDGVFWNNIYSENWSDSEAMTISLKLCSAMAPKLRAVLLDRAESIDQPTQQAIHDWAVLNDIQVVMTIVDDIPDEHEQGCFYIEEGKLV